MGIQKLKIKCRKCRRLSDSLWPSAGWLCDKCIVKKYSLEYILKNTCECMHSRAKELYAKKT